MSTSCAFGSSCHGGAGAGLGDLNFERAIDEGTVVEVLTMPSCEYDRMPRVDPGDAENSWLMIKIAGAHDAERNIEFTPADDWDHGLTPEADGSLPPSSCPLTQGGELSFGTLMPALAGAELEEERIEMFRQWIEMGAPGPTP